MITIHFTVPGRPRGKQRPRVTKNGSFTPKETRKYEAAVKMAFNTERWVSGTVYDSSNVTQAEAAITAYFPVPSSWPKAKRECAFGTPYTGKPDADNIAKIILDALNGIAYTDDAMVTCVNVAKRYCCEGEQPRVEVTLALALPNEQ